MDTQPEPGSREPPPASVRWASLASALAESVPGYATDCRLDRLCHELDRGRAGADAASVLRRALALARSDLAIRGVAFRLAALAVPDDVASVDVLLAAMRAPGSSGFRRMSLMTALSGLAACNEYARAALESELLRLGNSDSPDVLIRAAKLISRQHAKAPQRWHGEKLAEFANAEDGAVRAEAAMQTAYVLLADIFRAPTAADLHEQLATAQAAFARAHVGEEHRPDARLLYLLLEMALTVGGLLQSPDAVIKRLAELNRQVGEIVAVPRTAATDYRTSAELALSARAGRLAGALFQAANASSEVERRLEQERAVLELAAVCAVLLAEPTDDERTIPGFAAVLNTVVLPQLGPVLERRVGLDRLEEGHRAYIHKFGDDELAAGLRSLTSAVARIDDRPLLSADGVAAVRRMAEAVGRDATELVRSLEEALGAGTVDLWARGLGLPSPPLAIDVPGLLGGSADGDETVRELLFGLRQQLGSYPAPKWLRLVELVDRLVQCAGLIRSNPPPYARCAADGGKGSAATEADLQNDLFDRLTARFGHQVRWEASRVSGGRPDLCVAFDECRFSVEVKAEHHSVSREHLKRSYGDQLSDYAAAQDGVAFLIVLDLREHHADKHLGAQRRRRQSGRPPSPQISLYRLQESFWLDQLSPDPEIRDARPGTLVIGLIPGNRVLPSRASSYSSA